MEEMHPEQVKAYKKMTPAQRLAIAAQLWHEARQLKSAYLKQQHPDWSDEKIKETVREIFLYART